MFRVRLFVDKLGIRTLMKLEVKEGERGKKRNITSKGKGREKSNA
jgi:hypothetical protein